MGRLAEQARDMARIADWLARDVDDGPVNADDDGLKSLAKRGFEVKNGVLAYPASDGKLYELWPVDSVFGAAARKDREFQTKALVSLQPSYRAILNDYIADVARSSTGSQGVMARRDGWAQKALSEGSDPGGGFVVPASYVPEIRSRQAAYSCVWPYAHVVSVKTDLAVVPIAQAAAAPDDSVYESGFVGSWATEVVTASSTIDPTFGSVTIPVRKTRAASKVSNDFIADQAADFLAWALASGGRNLATVQDRGFLSGDGTGLKILGILNTPGLVTTDVTGTTATTISNTTANPGSAPKLKTLAYSLPDQYVRGARWVMLRATEGNARKLVDAQNHFLFPEDDDAEARGFIGRPIDNSPGMPPDGTGIAGAKVVLFGDMDGFVIAHRGLVTLDVFRETYADLDQTLVRLIDRVGGAVANVDAFRAGTV